MSRFEDYVIADGVCKVPRLISQVPAATENSFVVQGKHFEYLSLDDESRISLMKQTEGYYLHRYEYRDTDHNYNHNHSSDITKTYTDRPITSIHSLTEPLSMEDQNGEIIVDNGRITGIVLYVGEGCYRDERGRYMIRLNKTVEEDSGLFTILYFDGTVEGKNERSTRCGCALESYFAYEEFSITTTPQSDRVERPY